MKRWGMCSCKHYLNGVIIKHPFCRIHKEDNVPEKVSYTLPDGSPWLVEIEGESYPVQSNIARLLLQLDLEINKLRKALKKKAPAKKKK